MSTSTFAVTDTPPAASEGTSEVTEATPGGENTPKPPEGPKMAPEGYPLNTPIKNMTAEQQAAYWQVQSRKHEERSRARANYDDIVAENARLKAALESGPATLPEDALEVAREEGRQEANQTANTNAVSAILAASLRLRGKTDEQITTALTPVDPTKFVTNGQVDEQAILSYVELVAGPVTGASPDYGAGRRGSPGSNSRRAAGLAEAERRFGKRDS